MSDSTGPVSTPTAAPATPASPAQGTANSQATTDTSPQKSPKEVAKEAFKKEQAELVSKMEKERSEAASNPREQKPKDKSPKDAPSEDTKEDTDQKPEAPAKKKLKVNGKEMEFTDEEIMKRASLYEASEQKFQHASKVQKQAESFIRALQEDPESVLSHPALNVNLQEFAEKIIWKHLQKEMTTPEEQARLAEREELEKYRNVDRQRKEQEEATQREQLKEKYRQDWSKKFTQALDQGGLPKTDWTVQRMAQYMQQAISNGHKHIQPEDVVDMVKDDWVSAQKQMFSNLDPDKLVAMIGEENAAKIRKHDLARFGKESNKVQNQQEPEQESPKFGSMEEMQRYLRSKRG
jgi:hypothetical protein